MSRLKDADEFKKFLQALCKAGAPYDEVIQLLDKEPTACTIEEFKALKEKNEILKTLYEDARKEGSNLIAKERTKTIDEFVEKITLEISKNFIFNIVANYENYAIISDKIVDYVIKTSKEIAEQMKGSE